jgi:hypothetical protein
MIRVDLILIGLRRLKRRRLLGNLCDALVRVDISLNQELSRLPVDSAEISGLLVERRLKKSVAKKSR